MRPNERFLSVADVQRELRLSGDQVLTLIADGQLAAFQVLGEWRVERAMLDLFVDRRYAESAGPLAEQGGARAPAAAPSATRFRGQLSTQQQRILDLVASGLSNAEIAHALSVEVSTVKTHVSRLLQRFALRDREQLIAHAWRHGMVRDVAPEG